MIRLAKTKWRLSHGRDWECHSVNWRQVREREREKDECVVISQWISEPVKSSGAEWS